MCRLSKGLFVFGAKALFLLHTVAGANWSPQYVNNGIPYRVWIPSGYNQAQRYPAVLFLHSSGGRGRECYTEFCDDLSYLVYTGQSIEPHFVIVPQCDSEQRWVNVEWNHGSYSIDEVPISTPMKGAIGALDNVIATYSIDTMRLYVCGGSMGGYGTWDAICRFPQRFAAAHPVAGAGDPDRAARLTSVGIWAFHGSQDWTVPVAGSQEMIEAITAAGGSPRYSQLPVGHLWDLQFFRNDPEIFEWIFSHRRSATPTVSVVRKSTAFSSAHHPSGHKRQLLLSGREITQVRSAHLVLSPLPQLLDLIAAPEAGE